MATRIIDSIGSRAIGPHMPLNVALAIIPSLPRPILSRLVTRALERMDEIDGDPDLEPDGDELDGNPAEDDFWLHSGWLGQPGCSIADPGEEDDHSGDPCDEGEREEGVLIPVYAIDQTAGPLARTVLA